MNQTAWLRRLSTQLPGWHVWYSGAGGVPGTSGWYAVPAPAEVTHDEALPMPDRMGPMRTPQQLREVCRVRYGWDDYCETCQVLARECGHRQPETRFRGRICDTCQVPARECGHLQPNSRVR